MRQLTINDVDIAIQQGDAVSVLYFDHQGRAGEIYAQTFELGMYTGSHTTAGNTTSAPLSR